MRHPFLALVVLASPVAAEPGGVAAQFAIGDEDQLRGGVEAYIGPLFGGMRGSTLANPERFGTLAVYVGLRPALGPSRFNLEITRPLDAQPRLDIDFERPLGRRAAFSAGLDLDAEAEVAQTEAGASLELTRRTRLDASLRGVVDPADDRVSLRLSATRQIAPGSSLDIGLVEAERAPPRATLSLVLRF